MAYHNQLFLEFTKMVDNPLIIGFVFSILIDVFTGFTKSWVGKGTQSTKGLNGLIKHLSVFVLVIVAYPYVQSVHLGTYMNAFVISFIVSYWVSIFENLGQMGIPVGKYAKDHLLKLQEQYLKGEEHEK